jgi:hypothetical protein
MNSGVKNIKGLGLNYPQSYEECILLKNLLYSKFKLESIIESTSVASKYAIIIKKECIIKLESIVGPFIIKSMKYKLQTPFAKDLSYTTIIPKYLNPWFITGFSDAEAAFMVFITKNYKLKLGYHVQVCYQIGLNEKDRNLLEMIQTYFKEVGNILKQGKELYQYRVTSVKDILLIIEHFDNYPLITQKKADYELFKQVFKIINNKEHLTKKGLEQIVAIKASMNKGLSEELINIFSNIKPIPRPIIINQTIKDPNWIAGFVSGDGNFLISIFKSNNRTGFTIRLMFRITQHSRDIILMKSLISYLGCGFYAASYTSSNLDYGNFVVSNLPDINQKIIPFFKKYPINGNKNFDYSDFCKAASIMTAKGHTTLQGLEEIRKLKKGMNKGR